MSWGPGDNYRNYSVRTTVNITDSYPEILNIICNNNETFTLNPGGTQTLYCHVEILDYNGGNTINNTNATFYYYLNSSSDPDDNNEHYTNTTCIENNTGGYYTNWTCAFDIWYYANNGTWIANITVIDSPTNFTDNAYTTVTITSLYALNVTPEINYGDLKVGDTSLDPVQANITNLGNMDINITVYGFGGEDEITGAGLAMICDQRNITLSNQRFSLDSLDIYDTMVPATGAPEYISGLTIPQQTNDTNPEINSTYWMLHVNATTNPFGICNGTLIFSAEAP